MTNALQNISHINDCLKWIKEHKPEDYGQRFLQLVEERRKLRILENAERNNPGIAAFGQSQVGKSYLMNCILQNKGTSFTVKSPNGIHDFVDEINPIGGGAEATGVVTRFSSYNRNKDAYSDSYPIRFRALKIYDILLIICGSYFNQFYGYYAGNQSKIEQFLEELSSKYSAKPSLGDNMLCADDMLEMRQYFKHHIDNGQMFSNQTQFFQTLALLIDKIPVTEYINVFSILWNNEKAFSTLFCSCINIIQRINFQEYIYLPIESVLHNGNKPDTIMSVSCLELLYDEKARNYTTKAYEKNGSEIGEFTKSELCTICSEVIIRIEDSFLNSTGSYDFRGISEENKHKLPQEEISMSLLKDNDLLDFPGARPPEKGELNGLLENKTTLMYSFLRGKVEYLFNKYNEEQSINILLYCHHQKNNDATEMWRLLNSWVKDYVGETVEKRSEFIDKTIVSPLFHIGTMFNTDLGPSDNATVGNTSGSILARWNGRFKDLLLNKCFHQQDVDWVNNWTNKQKSFQNCYMLRDYRFSKNIYDGFEKTQKEENMLIGRDYYDTMRDMFIRSNEEHHLFADASLSWDTSATIGNDGALYIIQQLSIVASRIYDAREIQIKDRVRNVAKIVSAIMRQYYVSDDTSELLKENVRKANEIFREMDFAVQHCPEYFGHLISELQLTETESFRYLHAIIPTLGSLVNDPKADYELISKRCDNFEGCKTDSDKWNVLIKVYRFENQEAAEKYLNDKNIKVSDLFKGEFIKRTNSAVITDGILKCWKKRFTEAALKFSDNGADASKMNTPQMVYLTDCLIAAAMFVNLSERIEKAISPFVDILDIHSVNEYFVADIIASIVSGFVMDFGYSYLSDEQIQSAKRVAAEQHLPAFNYMEKERPETYDEDAATALFNNILSLSKCFTPAYDDNYNSWLEYMYVAFVANLNVPDYDRDANDKLKTLLEALK